MEKNNFQAFTIIGVVLILVIVFSGPLFMLGLGMFNVWPGSGMNMMHHGFDYDDHEYLSSDDDRLAFIQMKDDISKEMRDEGNYECCLLNPCAYCIEKTPGHGEGASCHCLDDIMNGEHPCGECIGEILEGHGNKHAAMYFATSLADELGTEYLDMLKQIMTEKYNLTIEEQL